MKIKIENYKTINKADIDINGITILTYNNEHYEHPYINLLSNEAVTVDTIYNAFAPVAYQKIQQQEDIELYNIVYNTIAGWYEPPKDFNGLELLVWALDKSVNTPYDKWIDSDDGFDSDKTEKQYNVFRIQMGVKFNDILKSRNNVWHNVAVHELESRFRQIYPCNSYINVTDDCRSTTCCQRNYVVPTKTILTLKHNKITATTKNISCITGFRRVYRIDRPFVEYDEFSEQMMLDCNDDDEYLSLLCDLEDYVIKQHNMKLYPGNVVKDYIHHSMKYTTDNMNNFNKYIERLLQIVRSYTGFTDKENIEPGNESLIIFEHPEAYIHPKEQVILAGFICLMQKYFNYKFVITTASPYILRAFEVYTAYYNGELKTLHEIKTDCYLNNKKEDTEKIYKSFARPFQELENLQAQITE